MNKIFLDTETINFISNVDYDVLTQLSYIVANNKEVHDTYAKPSNYLDMSIEAQEATDITPEFLEDKPLIQTTEAYKRLQEITEQPTYFFAHNADFDLEVVKRTGIDVSNFHIIDTMKLCRFINDQMELPWDSVRLTYLKYKLKLYKNRDTLASHFGIDLSTITSHNSLSDCIDLMLLWNYLSSTYNISTEQAVDLCKRDLVLTYMPSGKHKGTKFTDLDYNTLKWNADNSYDENIKFTCKRLLSK